MKVPASGGVHGGKRIRARGGTLGKGEFLDLEANEEYTGFSCQPPLLVRHRAPEKGGLTRFPEGFGVKNDTKSFSRSLRADSLYFVARKYVLPIFFRALRAQRSCVAFFGP